jgi:predicted nucleotidyltransferase
VLCSILRYVPDDEGKYLNRPFNQARYGYVLEDREHYKHQNPNRIFNYYSDNSLQFCHDLFLIHAAVHV